MFHWSKPIDYIFIFVRQIIVVLCILSACHSPSEKLGSASVHSDPSNPAKKTSAKEITPEKSFFSTIQDSAGSDKSFISYQDDVPCKFTHQYTARQRRAFYPFNRASRIAVISFDNYDFNSEYETEQYKPAVVDYIPASTDIENDSMIPIELEPEYIPDTTRKIFIHHTKDSLVLSNQQIDQLTLILYNYSFRKNPTFFSTSLCYEPRHKIIFYNAKNLPFAFIEICLECRKETHSEKVILGDLCTEKWTLLQNFFQDIGITYGLKD